MKIFTLEEIREVARISSSRSDIHWELLKTKKNQKMFLDSLTRTVDTIPVLEQLHQETMAAIQDLETSDAMVNEFTLRLQDALHEAYVCRYVRETYLAIRDITGDEPPKRRRRRNPPAE